MRAIHGQMELGEMEPHSALGSQSAPFPRVRSVAWSHVQGDGAGG